MAIQSSALNSSFGCSYGSGSNVSGGSTSSSGSSSSYTAYLNASQCAYNNILAGYNALQQQQGQAQGQIEAGYQSLYNNVLGTVQGVDQSQLNQVQKTYTQQAGMQQQQAINSGLGNSTVLASLQRGVVACEALAQTQVTNQYAQLLAGYQSQLGLASLNYLNQANMQNTALGVQQLQFECHYMTLPFQFSSSSQKSGGGQASSGGQQSGSQQGSCGQSVSYFPSSYGSGGGCGIGLGGLYGYGGGCGGGEGSVGGGGDWGGGNVAASYGGVSVGGDWGSGGGGGSPGYLCGGGYGC